jgi:hypothetical protein
MDRSALKPAFMQNGTGMFIRKKKGSYKGRTFINYQLVESVGAPEGP